MMLALFDYLRENNIKGLHLGTTSHNREAVPFYEHMGFSVLWKNRLTCYDHAIDDPPLVNKILAHLGLPTGRPEISQARSPPQARWT